MVGVSSASQDTPWTRPCLGSEKLRVYRLRVGVQFEFVTFSDENAQLKEQIQQMKKTADALEQVRD